MQLAAITFFAVTLKSNEVADIPRGHFHFHTLATLEQTLVAPLLEN